MKSPKYKVILEIETENRGNEQWVFTNCGDGFTKNEADMFEATMYELAGAGFLTYYGEIKDMFITIAEMR